jgi:hypothetical protein
MRGTGRKTRRPQGRTTRGGGRPSPAPGDPWLVEVRGPGVRARHQRRQGRRRRRRAGGACLAPRGWVSLAKGGPNAGAWLGCAAGWGGGGRTFVRRGSKIFPGGSGPRGPGPQCKAPPGRGPAAVQTLAAGEKQSRRFQASRAGLRRCDAPQQGLRGAGGRWGRHERGRLEGLKNGTKPGPEGARGAAPVTRPAGVSAVRCVARPPLFGGAARRPARGWGAKTAKKAGRAARMAPRRAAGEQCSVLNGGG